jgi:hypothetical protein
MNNLIKIFFTFEKLKNDIVENNVNHSMLLMKGGIILSSFSPLMYLNDFLNSASNEKYFDITLFILNILIIFLVAKLGFYLSNYKFSWSIFLNIMFAIVWRLFVLLLILSFLILSMFPFFTDLIPQSEVISSFSPEAVVFEVFVNAFLILLLPLTIQYVLKR